MDGSAERALVAAARSDPDAFAELYRRHVDAIHAFAFRRTGSRALAEDLTSATFVRALEKIHQVSVGDAGLRPWLYRLAANEVADHHRTRRRHASDRNTGIRRRFHVVVDDGPDDTVVRADEHERLRRALDALGRRHATVLTLAYFTELDRDEVAEALGLRPNALAVALHRARQALRTLLEEDR